MLIGYARISTIEQTLALQQDALAAAGCQELYTDTASGARTDRPGLAQALSHLRSGDTLVVWRLDRLGHVLGQIIGQGNRGTFRDKTNRKVTLSLEESLATHLLDSLVAQETRDLILG